MAYCFRAVQGTILILQSRKTLVILPQGLIIKFIFRRVLFEKVQNNGDCCIIGRFCNNLNLPPKGIDVNNFQEEKQ